MRSSGTAGSFQTLVVSAGACLILAVLVGIGIAVVLSLIPTYSKAEDFTPSGEQYCTDRLQMLVQFNNSLSYAGFNSINVNTSYALSQACYRILQNYKSDSTLQACLVSYCNMTNVTTALPAGTILSTNMTCYSVVYYSTRCASQAVLSGVNNTVSSSGNTACRTKRMTAINSALGSSTGTQYTNVPSLTINGLTIPIINITTIPYSNYTYTQLGARYCGGVTQAAITSVVNSQASGLTK